MIVTEINEGLTRVDQDKKMFAVAKNLVTFINKCDRFEIIDKSMDHLDISNTKNICKC